MDQKAVALQLRKLASDPDNQTYIVREKGCMKGLLSFLDSPNPEVVMLSLQALQFLASHPSNPELLSKEPGLVAKLVNFVDSENETIKTTASSTLDYLHSAVNGKDDEAKKTPMIVAPPVHGYLCTVPLRIVEARTDMQTIRIQKALITVKGVVSVTFNKNDVLVYCRTNERDIVHLLVAAVKAVGFTAVSGQGQQDDAKSTTTATGYPTPVTGSIATPMKAAPNGYPAYPTKAAPVTTPAAPTVGSKENGPRYLNTTGYPSTPSYLNPAAIMKATDKTTVTEYGKTPAQKKQEDAAKAAAANNGASKGLFGAVTSYFW